MNRPGSRFLGRLTILQARMNPDLAMGDALLKKTARATCSWSSESPTPRFDRPRVLNEHEVILPV